MVSVAAVREHARPIVRAARARVGADECVLVVIPLRVDPRVDRLTAAEREVLRVLITGVPNARIAAARGTSIRTVANQVRRVFAKLGVSSRGELAIELGDVAIGVEREIEGAPPDELGSIEASAVLGALIEGRLRCVEVLRRDAEHRVLLAAPPDPPMPLSKRRVHVLQALVRKTPVKAIARDLDVSEATVWSEIAALTDRLGFCDRTEMLRVIAPLAPSSWRA